MENRVEDDRRGAALEGHAAGGHLVEHRAERKQVRTRVERLAARLLGGHVGHRAEGRAGVGQLVLGHRRHVGFPGPGDEPRRPELGKAEVENLHLARPGHKNVRRLDVPVSDAARVGRVERL